MRFSQSQIAKARITSASRCLRPSGPMSHGIGLHGGNLARLLVKKGEVWAQQLQPLTVAFVKIKASAL